MPVQILLPPSGLTQQGSYCQLIDTNINKAAFASIVITFEGGGPDFLEQIDIKWDDKRVHISVSDEAYGGNNIFPFRSGSLSDYIVVLEEHLKRNELLLTYWKIESASTATTASITFTFKELKELTPVVTHDLSHCTVTITPSTGPYYADNLSAVLKIIEIDHIGEEELTASLTAPFDAKTGIAEFEIGGVFNLEPHLPFEYTIYENYQALGWGEATKAYRTYYLRYSEKYGSPPATVALFLSESRWVVLGGYRGESFKNFFNITYHNAACHQHFIKHLIRWQDGALFYKPVSKEQPDWVYVFCHFPLTNARILCQIYFDDDTTMQWEYPNTTFALEAYKLYWFPSGFRQMRLREAYDASDREVVRYEWRLVQNDGQQEVVYANRGYEVSCECHPWNLYLLYFNGLGGCETLHLKGKSQEQYDVTRELFRRTRWTDTEDKTGELGSFNAEGTQVWEVSTGWHSYDYIRRIRQVLMGDTWLINVISSRFLKVVIDTNSIKDVGDDQELFALTFTLRLSAFDKAFNYF